MHETMKEKENWLSVSMLCEIAGVSRSGYYQWVKSETIRERCEKKDREDFELILKAYNQRRYSKGARGDKVEEDYGSLEIRFKELLKEKGLSKNKLETV